MTSRVNLFAQVVIGDSQQATADGFIANSDVSYYCDTQGGSSGSPVISRVTNKVIALHHFGGCPNSGVRADLLDLTLVWSDFRVRLVPTGRAAAEREAAVAVLDAADRELGPCAGLYLDRAALLRLRGDVRDNESV